VTQVAILPEPWVQNLSIVASPTLYCWKQVKGQPKFKGVENRLHLQMGRWQRLCGHTSCTPHRLSFLIPEFMPRSWDSSLAKLLYSFSLLLTQCSRQPPQINQSCHKKWNMSAIRTLQWVVSRVSMENSDFPALNLVVSLLLVSSLTFHRLY
jgi:hypothetical protein